MDETVKFLLDAGNNGWVCSGCGMKVDSSGRPLLGNETWFVTSKGTSWIENYPRFNFCPQCGKRCVKIDA